MVWACCTAPAEPPAVALEVPPEATAAGMTHVDVIFPPPAISPPLRKVGTMERMELEREADNAVADDMVLVFARGLVSCLWSSQCLTGNLLVAFKIPQAPLLSIEIKAAVQ